MRPLQYRLSALYLVWCFPRYAGQRLTVYFFSELEDASTKLCRTSRRRLCQLGCRHFRQPGCHYNHHRRRRQRRRRYHLNTNIINSFWCTTTNRTKSYSTEKWPCIMLFYLYAPESSCIISISSPSSSEFSSADSEDWLLHSSLSCCSHCCIERTASVADNLLGLVVISGLKNNTPSYKHEEEFSVRSALTSSAKHRSMIFIE